MVRTASRVGQLDVEQAGGVVARDGDRAVRCRDRTAARPRRRGGPDARWASNRSRSRASRGRCRRRCTGSRSPPGPRDGVVVQRPHRLGRQRARPSHPVGVTVEPTSHVREETAAVDEQQAQLRMAVEHTGDDQFGCRQGHLDVPSEQSGETRIVDRAVPAPPTRWWRGSGSSHRARRPSPKGHRLPRSLKRDPGTEAGVIALLIPSSATVRRISSAAAHASARCSATWAAQLTVRTSDELGHAVVETTHPPGSVRRRQLRAVQVEPGRHELQPDALRARATACARHHRASRPTPGAAASNRRSARGTSSHSGRR